VEVVRFTYDVLGRRVERIMPASSVGYLYDGQDILREQSPRTPTLQYVHGPGIDEPLGRTSNGTLASFYHADGLGSILKTTNASGVVTLTRQYDSWGKLEVGATTGSYAYTGREWDPETGLYYYRARYYDPKIGRFISEDPIGFEGGVNYYEYAASSPVANTDPFGLTPIGLSLADHPECAPPSPLPPGAGRFRRLMHAISSIMYYTNPCGLMPGVAVLQAPEEVCFRLTATVAAKAASRPYVNSPLVIREIMHAGKSVPDPGGIPGGVRWDVPGGFLPASKCCATGTPPTPGTWELVMGPDGLIYHFLFNGR
jgi:RHS repeat-associated protein